MKRLIFILTAILACASAVAQGNEGGVPAEPVKVSYSVLHNEFYEASLKARSLARFALEQGDYDASIFQSSESERLARLSDEYIGGMMLRARAMREIQSADDRILWARSNEAATYYPAELAAASAHYDEAVAARSDNDWSAALQAALAVADDLAGVAAPPKKGAPPPDMPPNPNQYKVRPWDVFGDCFWNIAKWFYGDPWKWPVVYEANKDKIPDPDNPDLIESGTVIDIPGIGNEMRVGLYDTGIPYPIQR
jgi:nucleoid-associated protein YgaU